MIGNLRHNRAVAASVTKSSLSLWRGTLVLNAVEQPPKNLVLYEYEASTDCRAVREAFTALHLDVEIRPCPIGGTRFRPEAVRLSGDQILPVLVDHNGDTTLNRTGEIVDYLFRHYGEMQTPRGYRAGLATTLFSSLARGLARGRGAQMRPSRLPLHPLQLWGFESSPYSRLVRERLSELELPYTLHNLGKEQWQELGPAARRLVPNPYVPKPGGKRHAFWLQHGRVQLPYLDDPNQQLGLFESQQIIDHIEQYYAL